MNTEPEPETQTQTQTPDLLDQLGCEVEAFANHLLSLPTATYALNHTQMEAWVALEGLEFFARSGWKTCETVGFITAKPVRPNKDSENKNPLGIKFPDLVAVRDTVSLWFEFKTISRRALHPKSGGGTLVKDLVALAAFDREQTTKYLTAGKLKGVRINNDGHTIRCSGLFEKKTKGPLAAANNVGVVMMLWPPEAKLPDPHTPGETWSPAEQVDSHRKAIANLGYELVTVGCSEPEGSTPKWEAWLVRMGSTP